jgi:hypothetical protein
MKAALAAALAGFQSLGHDDLRERPVDRVGAAGAAQIRGQGAELEAIKASLGVDLIRFKFSRIDRAGKDAEDMLSGILAWPSEWKPYGNVKLCARERDLVARCAVHEWANDKCPPRPDGCGGALEVPSAEKAIDGRQPMMACPRCKGNGIRRWTDDDRVERMGAGFSEGMARAHAIIGEAEALALRRARDLLERW